MTDIALFMPNGSEYRPRGDVAVEHVRVPVVGSLEPKATRTIDLVVDNSLRTSVYLSLFTDRRADRSDVDRDASLRDAPLRGTWIDDLLAGGDRWGSRLWTIRTGKATTETLRRAEHYAKEALEWMIAQGISDLIEVDASFHETREDRLILNPRIYRGSSKLYDETWGYSLAA